ncbi:MAG: DUF1622 domain-containing protein [Clostridium sp.]|uniref:DUF1622 domain-containing protein n=1 Tax=Clostridium sp. TaxID=1506 RepID=UPI002FCB3C40
MDIKHILEILIFTIQGLSIIILAFGVILSFLKFLKLELTTKNKSNKAKLITAIKNYLASYILLGLELLISADIIESIVNPSIEDILRLAAIVIIRTVISYFLNKEMKSDENNKSIKSASELN